MAGERRINWGADATDARYRTEDTGDGANFVVAEDLDGGTVLLEYDDTASEWVSRGPINMDGNAISNVSDLDVSSVSTDEQTITGFGTISEGGVVDHGTVSANSGSTVSVSFTNSYSSAPGVMHGLGTSVILSSQGAIAREIDTSGFVSLAYNDSGSDNVIDLCPWFALET